MNKEKFPKRKFEIQQKLDLQNMHSLICKKGLLILFDFVFFFMCELVAFPVDNEN